MRVDTFDIPIGEMTYRAEAPSFKVGLTCTLTARRDKTELRTDRLNLDKARDRERYAEAAGIPEADLRVVRETVLEAIAGTSADVEVEEPEPDEETKRAALHLLNAPDLLDQAAAMAGRLGYSAAPGVEHLPKLVYLALTSRTLDRPINLLVSGPSAAGKSFLVSTVSRLFPANATYQLSGMSERVLAYSQASLEHRMLVIGEASALHRDGIGASMLRAVAWEGKLVYETVEKSNEGLKPVRIEKDGPTGFITTTTGAVEKELATRLLEVSVPDTPAVTESIVLTVACRANGNRPETPDLAPWQELQRWLATEGDHDVVIPFAEDLGREVPHTLVRMRRDFTQILTLIAAHAVLYQQQRNRSDDGRIIAERADYEAVYTLTAPLFQAIAAEGVTEPLRETVAAVKDLTKDPDDTVMLAKLAGILNLDKSSASRRVRRALRDGYLINLESRKGQPMKLRPGDPLPDAREALPNPEKLFTSPACNRATVQHEPENPHGDNENTVARAVAQRKTMQPPMQPQKPHGDAENADGIARLHGCTEEEAMQLRCKRCGAGISIVNTTGLCGRCLTKRRTEAAS